MSNFSVKKIKFTSKQFLNFVPKSYYSVPITLKNAPLWNFLRHQCLKCAHMSTIALTIRHTAIVDKLKKCVGRNISKSITQPQCKQTI